MIKKVLIANRGEIACRVIKTCRRLGIATVAVYSDADASALHVELADESFRIGPAPARESYLDIGAVLEAARLCGADAVHPGYGFLSESAAFARACAGAGIIFIGPPPDAIEAMGGKSHSKALMQKAGVPLVPGYHGDRQDTDFLLVEAEKIGFPVLLKASSGGGGKGMRVVESTQDFAAAADGARREAKSSFGDDRLLVEKYLRQPRHVEVQVFADGHGNCVYLSERDCSIQRRHQKVLEEAPAPALPLDLREKMGASAVAAAQAVGYEGAGTVEFLLDAGGSYYFMEMNTRLQVEHPVTEMVTGLDLVEMQIHVAQGGTLPFAQSGVQVRGHAIEARLYAEDPDAGFLPAAGKIEYLRFPEASADVRIDTGVREARAESGDDIGIFYDPMIAKIIVHAADRASAIAKLAKVLDETRIAGLKTNLGFLRAVSRSDAFASSIPDTGFIEANRPALFARAAPSRDDYALAVLGLLKEREDNALRRLQTSSDPYSPWNDLGVWRAYGGGGEAFRFGDLLLCAVYDRGPASPEILFPDDSAVFARYTLCGGDRAFDAWLDDRRFNATVLRNDNRVTVLRDGVTAELDYAAPLSTRAQAEETGGSLHAPMPGKVVALHVAAGDSVKKGQPLVTVEAMKMEHAILAPADGVVAAVQAFVGEQVDEKRILVDLDESVAR